MSRADAAPDRRAAWSIAWPIFALTVASVVAAALTIFAVTFNGPPARTTPGAIPVVTEALRSGMLPEGAARRLRVETRNAPPAIDGPFRADAKARAALAAALGVPMSEVVAYTMRPTDAEEGAFGRDFVLGWRHDGRWRVVETPRPFLAPWHLTTLLAMLAAVLALAVPAWIIAQAISRPVRAVARAAEKAKAGGRLPPLPAGGAREVRDLSRAVAAMHDRLARHAEGRTTMLAAIAHDLGTPLSRLAFRVELLPEAARDKAAADIAEMRAMIGAALSFARDEAVGPAARLDLGSLLESLAADMGDAGHDVTVAAGPRAIVRGDPVALRRLFANLVENAVRYGARAAIGWTVADGTVTVTIDDHGPGVDPAAVERLFEPFVRGDPSRNRATGGTGLGLAIVRSIAARHDGEAVLENGPTGARARVTLPLA